MAKNKDLSETEQDEPLTYDTIRDLCHSMDKTDPLYPKVYRVWMAMTDWIVAVPNTAAFLNILHQEVKNDLTKDNLDKHLKGFRGQYGMSGIAWKAETIAGISKLFAHYPDAQTLKEVFVLFDEDVRMRVA